MLPTYCTDPSVRAALRMHRERGRWEQPACEASEGLAGDGPHLRGHFERQELIVDALAHDAQRAAAHVVARRQQHDGQRVRDRVAHLKRMLQPVRSPAAAAAAELGLERPDPPASQQLQAGTFRYISVTIKMNDPVFEFCQEVFELTDELLRFEHFLDDATQN